MTPRVPDPAVTAARIRLGRRRVVWAGGTLWFRTYTVGGYDGYRTLTGRRLPCGEVERLARPIGALPTDRGTR